jgi:hypothetical protein
MAFCNVLTPLFWLLYYKWLALLISTWPSLRMRLDNICYTEPSLKKKMRQQGQPEIIQHVCQPSFLSLNFGMSSCDILSILCRAPCGGPRRWARRGRAKPSPRPPPRPGPTSATRQIPPPPPPGPHVVRRPGLQLRWQGLTLVHFPAQRKRFVSDRGCI